MGEEGGGDFPTTNERMRKPLERVRRLAGWLVGSVDDGCGARLATVRLLKRVKERDTMVGMGCRKL